MAGRRAVLVGAFALLLVGCGVLQATPARHPPPLPPSQPLPRVPVEDLVEQLGLLGFDCWFDRGGDIPSSWNCRRGDQESGDWSDVGMQGGRTGPIESIGASRYILVGPDTGPEPAVLDQSAVALFEETVVALVLPDEQHPTVEALHSGVQRNFPIELGGGWYLGFDRNANSRSVRVVFAPDD